MGRPVWPAPRYCATGPYLSDLFLGDFLSRVETSNFAVAGAWILLLITMSCAVTPFPYSLSLPSLSGRSVEPSREIPANNPREREYDRISARMVTSVEAAALAALGSGCCS